MIVRRALAALGFAWLAANAASAGEIPGAIVVLEAAPGTPGSDATGAPPRFVLLKDGQLFVGGTAAIEVGRLDKDELQSLRKRLDNARKGLARGQSVSFGGGDAARVRLRLLEDRPTQVEFDPAAAPPALQPLATLVSELLRFDHPSLAPYVPSSYALAAREARLAGGCRRWSFAVAIDQALAAAVAVPAADVGGWPTGALPASVCIGESRYVVTLRPLLPGELP